MTDTNDLLDDEEMPRACRTPPNGPRGHRLLSVHFMVCGVSVGGDSGGLKVFCGYPLWTKSGGTVR